MEKVVYYLANDGEQFDTEEECLEYENRRNNLLKQVIFYDGNLERIKEWSSVYDLFCDTMALYVPNTTLLEELDALYREHTDLSPFEEANCRNDGFYYYDNYVEQWLSVEAELKRLNNIKTKLIESGK